MLQEKTVHFWLRNNKNQRVACVAATFQPDRLVQYAVACHNPKDKFSKERGHFVAQGRLDKSFQTAALISDAHPMHALVVELIEDKSLPHRVRRAAEKWLNDHPIKAQGENSLQVQASLAEAA